jgi:hypothetical protein
LVPLDQNEVANMLPLELQEFSLDPNGSNSREASRTDGVHRFIWILSMSEFDKFSHHDQARFSRGRIGGLSSKLARKVAVVNKFPSLTTARVSDPSVIIDRLKAMSALN